MEAMKNYASAATKNNAIAEAKNSARAAVKNHASAATKNQQPHARAGCKTNGQLILKKGVDFYVKNI